MIKAFCLLAVAAFVLTVTAPVYAELPKPISKLTHGTMDVVSSPFVIFEHTSSQMDSADYKAVGFLKGLVTSPFHVVKKAGLGVVDIVTFPIE